MSPDEDRPAERRARRDGEEDNGKLSREDYSPRGDLLLFVRSEARDLQLACGMSAYARDVWQLHASSWRLGYVERLLPVANRGILRSLAEELARAIALQREVERRVKPSRS